VPHDSAVAHKELEEEGDPLEEDEGQGDASSRSLQCLEDDECESVAHLSLADQLRSRHFAFATIFGVTHIVRSNIFLGTIGDYLAELGDHGTGDVLTQFLSVSLTAGVFEVPLISWIIDRLGALRALHIVNLLGVVSFLPLLIPSLWWQLLSCLLYPLYRGLLYAALTTYMAQTFSAKSVGRTFGCVCLLSALVQPIQYPMVQVMAKHFHSLRSVYICLLLVAIVPTSITFLFEHSLNKQRPRPQAPSTLDAKAQAGLV